MNLNSETALCHLSCYLSRKQCEQANTVWGSHVGCVASQQEIWLCAHYGPSSPRHHVLCILIAISPMRKSTLRNIIILPQGATHQWQTWLEQRLSWDKRVACAWSVWRRVATRGLLLSTPSKKSWPRSPRDSSLHLFMAVIHG